MRLGGGGGGGEQMKQINCTPLPWDLLKYGRGVCVLWGEGGGYSAGELDQISFPEIHVYRLLK